jgi:hypothetical protein
MWHSFRFPWQSSGMLLEEQHDRLRSVGLVCPMFNGDLEAADVFIFLGWLFNDVLNKKTIQRR